MAREDMKVKKNKGPKREDRKTNQGYITVQYEFTMFCAKPTQTVEEDFTKKVVQSSEPTLQELGLKDLV